MLRARQWISVIGFIVWGWSCLAAAADREWQDLFNGHDLDGWHGDPTYWRVEEGVLVGEVTPDTILSRNSWLVYDQAEFADFELVVEFRVSAEGNSGIGYRCERLDDHPFSVRGPQADIDGPGQWMGNCYEENGRRFLALRGTHTRIQPGKLPELVERWATEEEALKPANLEGWNQMRIVARGNHLRQELNGELMCKVEDNDGVYGNRSGYVGVQVHIGPPMTIEYRSIRIRRLPADTGAAWREQPEDGERRPLESFTNKVTLQHLREASPTGQK